MATPDRSMVPARPAMIVSTVLMAVEESWAIRNGRNSLSCVFISFLYIGENILLKKRKTRPKF